MCCEKKFLEAFARELSQQTGQSEAILQWNKEWNGGEEVESRKQLS